MTVIEHTPSLLQADDPLAAAAARGLAVFRSGPEAAPRTLLDVLAATAARHPDAPALDDGTTALTYRALLAEVARTAQALGAAGVGLGDRVGVRVPSGTTDLYVAILGTLAAGAAYVPVDFDDPDERAELVFGEAAVTATLGAGLAITTLLDSGSTPGNPTPDHDAWVIFTSGSTGKPKGVAVSHRSAAAFVDAEAGLFLADEPIGPEDRVLAGLSVAFDASCEEMWLAWRNGACLVPAPRALVRTGVDLGPWLVEREITVVSTVPTLAALWPAEALAEVRLLIFGGEACPPELAARLAVEGREVWNTYGPTEATVVATAARLTGEGPVRIGLPLDGWELAVVDEDDQPVPLGGSGQLVIGGAGLARYLDPAKDAEKYAPLPALGWERAYRSGDLVTAEAAGLLFLGRADEQVKLGGRRIELGEVDAALQALPGVAGAAAAVRATAAGNQLLVGYVVTQDGYDAAAAVEALRRQLPAALVPLLAEVDTLPTRTSGKVDRAALPWPLDLDTAEADTDALSGTEQWLAGLWRDVLGVAPGSPDANFFHHGGGSLTAAQLVSRIREQAPGIAVADLYQHPTLGALAELVDAAAAGVQSERAITPTPRRAQVVQVLATVPLLTIVGARWVVVLAALANLAAATGTLAWAPTTPWWAVGTGWLLVLSPWGRMAIAAGGARLLLRGVTPGDYPRGGSVHLRLWAAERIVDLTGATTLAGAPWMTHYARALGARIGADVDLHSLPPVTGMLKLGRGAAVEPEVDLSGHWLDGDVLRIGRIRVGAGATVGSRSTLFPGARVGKRAEVAPGSGVLGAVPAGERWSGSPASRDGKAHQRPARPPRRRRWVLAYAVASLALSLFPVLAAVPALLVLGAFVSGAASLPAALGWALAGVPAATATWLVAYALLVLVSVRLLSIGLRAGLHPVHSRVAWQAWATERVMGLARVGLFPLYASLATPVWLRALGMKVGRRVEASTVLALPSMTTVGDGAFLADDTMVASYELGGGWLRIEQAKIGKRAFLGNSGMTAPGRAVPKRGLVGVLSSTPKKAKAGSSYLGMPPMRLPRTVAGGDESTTFDPPRRLVLARALVEVCRVLPVMATAALGVLVAAGFLWLGWWLGLLLGGLLLLGAGIAACEVAMLAKWLLVGRFRAVEHPLWSSFVWRNELADTFVEVLAVPWFVPATTGTPLLSAWLRALGARVGRGAWVETYWLPEMDLVTLGDGATVNRGVVVQTHLFHDRIMSMAPVTVGAGATLGPHGIALPGATVGDSTTVGPASLVMRGESVPPGTRWLGNPISAWPAGR
ncbi:Pls/PosA family non-ribosomal peptide synthetase [Actinokineospora bangkokensis]|uniref:Amino acid adenylation protein n=1 Tax=Actinokineospora bangkokensis TaxID=1193682 RepID=A0A1Q9LCT5_9PSEU|nr:Pls/PosA family non-ribosomal peptide synthetase [Actinokineospora bangkokensis]OLR89847.1 amino acid adenylation protein [Actinokineospora bangkokensis]